MRERERDDNGCTVRKRAIELNRRAFNLMGGREIEREHMKDTEILKDSPW